MEEHNTVDSILKALHEMAEQKEPISPHVWLEGCSKLLALVGAEQDKLFEMESVLAKVRSVAMEMGSTASKAKVIAEARAEFLEARKLKAKIDRIFEMIKLGKVMAKMATDEYRAQ